MINDTPLKLVSDFIRNSELEAIEIEASKIESIPPLRNLGSLKSPPTGEDQTELIKRRFLYRGAVCLLLGPTGIGKSSLLLQIAVHLAVGKTLFGLVPGTLYQKNGMRVLLVQAENDEGDLADMRDGVIAGCNLSQEETATALNRIEVCTINDRSGEKFIATLEALLTTGGPYDLLIIDPAFAYLGGDSNSQKDVSRFMREYLNPLLQRHQVGLILAHHTNKPLRGAEKKEWKAGDYAYLGAGSAEWVNPARAVLAIRSLGSDSVFELMAPKRGKRLGWKDENGITTTQGIAHSKDEGMIYWRKADPEELEAALIEPKNGRPRKVDPIEILHCVETHPDQNQAFYMLRVSNAFACSKNVVQNGLYDCIREGLIKATNQGRQKCHLITSKGREKTAQKPSVIDWNDHKP